MKTKLIIIVLAGLISGSAYCVDTPIPQPTPAKIQELINKLPRTTEVMVMHHWTTFETWKKWSRDGEISFAEFKKMLETGAGMARGGGLYLAEDKDSSRTYGDFALRVTIPKGTLILDHAIATAVLGVDAGSMDKAVLEYFTEIGKKIPFIDNVRTQPQGTWWVTHHHSLVSKQGSFFPIRDAQPEGTDFGNNVAIVFDQVPKLIDQVGADQGSIDYIQRLVALLYYGNTSEFFKALYRKPGSLNQIMPDALFARVQKVMSRWLVNASKGAKLVSIESLTRDEWVRSQMEKVLPAIYTDMTGRSSQGMWRQTELQGPKMFVDAFQAEAMRTNTVLQTQIKKVSDLKYEVQFKYPSAQTASQQMPKVLGQLYDAIKSNSVNVSALLSAFVSLAPFSEANDPVLRTYFGFIGRAARLYSSFGTTAIPPVQTLPIILQQPEDVLLAGGSSVIRWMRQTTQRSTQIAVGMLAELSRSHQKSKAPSYQNLPEQTAYPTSFKAFGETQSRMNIGSFLSSLDSHDVHGVVASFMKEPLWISNFDGLKGVVMRWRKDGRADLEKKVRESILASVKNASIGPVQIGEAFRLEPDPGLRRDWVLSLLKQMKLASQDSSEVTVFSVVPEIAGLDDDELAREVTAQYIEEFLEKLRVWANQGKFDEISKYSMTFLYYDGFARRLKIPRKRTMSYTKEMFDLFKTSEAGLKNITVLAFVIFESGIVTEAKTETEMLEVLALMQSYFQHASPESWVTLSIVLEQSGQMLEQGQLSAQTHREFIRLFRLETAPYLANAFSSILDSLELGEKLKPGFFQAEVSWYLERLTKWLDLGTPKYLEAEDRLKKLVKPASDVHRGSVNRPLSCSGLSRVRGN